MTNYHVLQSALAAIPRRPGGAPRPGAPWPTVAKVTLLGGAPPSAISSQTTPSLILVSPWLCIRVILLCYKSRLKRPSEVSCTGHYHVSMVSQSHVIAGLAWMCTLHKLSALCMLRGAGADGYNQTYDAVLVGADRTKDIAVLHINAPREALRPVAVGQSGRLRVGQQVLAIGNPFGFDHTLTTGSLAHSLIHPEASSSRRRLPT